MTEEKICSLILCAGESSRMGRAKAILLWNGKTFLNYAVSAAKQNGIENIVAVLGSHSSEIREEAKALKIPWAHNADWNLGMGSSIKVGVRWILETYPHTTGILIQLTDQPFVQGASLKKILGTHEENPGRIVAAQYENSLGVPVLFPRSAFSSLLTVPDSAGAKKVLVDAVPVSLPEAAYDIDTPEQFKSLENITLLNPISFNREPNL
jgi:molybdenum cofactor cytidylyltransferase